MAYEITRLLPFRQYDDNDVINFYSYDLETGEAGSVVKVSAANLQDEPVQYTQLLWGTPCQCILRCLISSPK